MYIGITQTEGSGGAGLVTFFKDRSSLTNAASSYSDVHVNPPNNLLARLAPVIPKVNYYYKLIKSKEKNEFCLKIVIKKKYD